MTGGTGHGPHMGHLASPRNLSGIGCMLLGMAGMGGVDASAKWLVGADYHVLQVLAVRGWFVTAALLIWVLATGKWRGLRTERPWGHLVRLAIAFLGPFFLFTALIYMPLADVTVIIFGSAFWTTVFAIPLFKEKVGPHRWAAVILGFLGVAIALRPGTELFQPIAILALLAGMAFAGINLTARWLRSTETTTQLVFYLMIGMTIVASIPLPFVWTPMPLTDLAIFAGMGVFTLIGYIFMTRAFVIAETGVVAPFEYSVLIYAVILGYLIWGEVPDAYVWTGAALIIGSGLYMIHRESRAV